MTKKPSALARVTGKPVTPSSSKLPVDVTRTTTRDDLRHAGRTALAKGKSAGRRIAAATKSTGKKVGKAAARVSDLNKDGKVDREDAKIATTKAKRITSKVADGAGTLAKKAAKHDMVKDAAAGAAIGAAVAIPVPVVGPVAGAAIGAIVGVAKNLRSVTKPVSEAPGKQPKSSRVKSAMRRIRKPRQSAAATPTAKPPRT
jgi:hypothetical protein